MSEQVVESDARNSKAVRFQLYPWPNGVLVGVGHRHVLAATSLCTPERLKASSTLASEP